MHKGIVICGHGTKSQEGSNAFFEVFTKLKQQISNDYGINFGFIEYAEPNLEAAIIEQIEKGASEIIILPLLLFSGVHTTKDIPNTILKIREQYQNVNFEIAETIDLNNKLIELCQDLIHQKLGELNGDANKKDLLVIGVGSSKPEANIKIATLTRILWERISFRNTDYAFISKMTFPSVDNALGKLAKIGTGDTIILPVIIFPGMYLKSINKKIEEFKKTSDGTIAICEPLYKNNLLIDSLLLRLNEVIKEKNEIIEI